MEIREEHSIYSLYNPIVPYSKKRTQLICLLLLIFLQSSLFSSIFSDLKQDIFIFLPQNTLKVVRLFNSLFSIIFPPLVSVSTDWLRHSGDVLPRDGLGQTNTFYDSIEWWFWWSIFNWLYFLNAWESCGHPASWMIKIKSNWKIKYL